MAEGRGGIGRYMQLQIAYALEFAIWGAWSYMLGTWAGVHHIAQGKLYAAFALGALFAPLVGPIADRKFAAQKVFAFMQAVCGLALLACAYFAGVEGELADKAFAKDPGALLNPSFAWQAMMFIAGFFFLPSIPLLNAIVFKHIPNSSKSPLVFVFGTIGWIVVNWVLSYMGTNGVEYFYIVDGGIAIALALYALTLPNTPPSGSKNDDPFGLKALSLFKRWDFATFMICATMVGIFGSNYYFAFVGTCFPDKGVWNQYSELIFMTALAFAAAKIGLKWVLTLGMLAWGVRYLCFATGNDPLAVFGILCHGIAYAFLYTAAYMYGDKIASKEQKASVQALIAFLLLGVAQTLSGYAADIFPKLFPGKDAAPQKPVVVLVESAAFAQDASIDEIAATAVESPAAEAAAPVAEVPAAVEAAAPVAEVVESPAAEAAAPAAEAAAPAAEAAAPAAEAAAPAAEAAAPANEKKSSLKTWWDRDTWKKYQWQYIWGIPGVWCLIFAILFALTGKKPKAPEEEK